MKLPDKFHRAFRAPPLTRSRWLLAVAIAVVADGLQLLLGLLGPVGFFFDEIIDVIAMVLTTRVLGFHVLLLPTFVLEFMPLAGLLPTWTGCVIAVIALRKREQRKTPPPPAQESSTNSAAWIDI